MMEEEHVVEAPPPEMEQESVELPPTSPSTPASIAASEPISVAPEPTPLPPPPVPPPTPAERYERLQAAAKKGNKAAIEKLVAIYDRLQAAAKKSDAAAIEKAIAEYGGASNLAHDLRLHDHAPVTSATYQGHAAVLRLLLQGMGRSGGKAVTYCLRKHNHVLLQVGLQAAVDCRSVTVDCLLKL